MMKKIIKNTKRRIGFTLVELLLVMALMLIFFGFIFSTFYLVNSSHANVVVINDAKDFAALNMDAVTTLIANAEHIVISDSKNQDIADHTDVYYTDSKLYYKFASTEKLAFTYDQHTIADGNDKWKITSTFTKSGTMLIVRLDVVDNASSDTSAYYSLSRTVYLPNITKSEKIEGYSGSVVTFKNF